MFKKIKYKIHAFFSVRCSRYIIKYGNMQRQGKRVKRTSLWFKICSYCEFKLRNKRYRTTITNTRITRQK